MDGSTIRVAVGLRLGAPLCRPHQCQHCGAEVDCLAIHMASAVVGAKVVITAMLLLTTSCTGPLHRQKYQHASNHQASTAQMESIQMASLWSPGKVESCWCGMRHALTPSHHRTHQGPPMRQGLWLLKRRRGRKPNIHTSTPHMPSPLTFSFRDFRWQYNVETQRRCWAQWTFREFRLFL